MRPIKLIIEGINSFDERQELDFERVGRSNLFCICGKTGAGKSTIFDSIMFALYGKSRRANLADMVNLSRNTAYVSFEFTERGDNYLVERTVKCTTQKSADTTKPDKRSGNADCILYKNGAILANTREGVSAVVDEIIGLGMSEFKNVYLLEQGEYAEFLQKPPAKQNEAVGKIFSLMRFADVYKRAKEHLAAEEEKAREVDKRINEIGADTPERLKDEKKKLTELKTKITVSGKELQNKKAELDALEDKRLEYAKAVEKQNAAKAHAEMLKMAEIDYDVAVKKLDEFNKNDPDADKAKLKELRERLTALTELNAQDKEYSAAVEECKQKQLAAGNKRNQAQTARDNHAAITAQAEEAYDLFDGAIADFTTAAGRLADKSVGVENAIRAFNAQDRAKRIDAVRDVIAELHSEKREYEARIEERKEQAEKLAALSAEASVLLEKIERYSRDERERAADIDRAKEVAEHARDMLEQARLMSHAAAVREAINEGDVCPVCGSVYHGGGEKCDDGAVTEAKAQADKAEVELKAAETKLDEIKRHHTQAADSYNRTDGEMRELQDKLRDIDGKIISTHVNPEIYRELAISMKSASEHGAVYTQKTTEINKQAPVLAAIEAELKAEEGAVKEAAARAERLKAAVGEYCGKTAELLEKAKEEERELEDKVAGQEEMRAELTSAAENAKGRVSSISAMLDEATKAIPVDMPEFDEDGYNDLKARYDEAVARKSEFERDAAVAEAAIVELTGRAERLKNAIAERDTHIKNAKCYGDIAEITHGKKMLEFVAVEYIEQFTAYASDILAEMTAGKYTMSYDSDNGFTVSDFLQSGKVRKTDTLSGGEIFLASLAVAIAIARTQNKGHNGFFFLDEGFGTLDEERIDTVYGALESLSRDCLVGVISHSDSLIGHMSSRVNVEEATDTRGSRITY